jgi:Molybdopterin biosynthesis enzyme
MNAASDIGEYARLTVEEATVRAHAFVHPLSDTEYRPIGEAVGRVLAQPVQARVPLPMFDNAAVDGYALASQRISDQRPPFELPVIARIAAGETPCALDSTAGAVRIFTGALVPAGFDTVLMQEVCERRGNHLTFNRPPAPGANVRLSGEDVGVGEDLLEAGLRIDARHVALAAAVGVSHMTVRRRPRAAVLSIGNELRDVSGRLGATAIYDSNRPMLIALLTSAGVEVSDFGVVRDEPDRLAAAVCHLASSHDLIVSTGGISVGDEDHVAAVMAERCHRHERLRMMVKPGKPAALAAIGAAIWLGLPGNAFAAFVGYLLLGRPILRALSGQRVPPQCFGTPAVAAFQWTRKPGRDEFFPARHVGLDAQGRQRVVRLGPGGSARLRPLSAADGLAMVAANVAEIREGSALTFLPFADAWCA